MTLAVLVGYVKFTGLPSPIEPLASQKVMSNPESLRRRLKQIYNRVTRPRNPLPVPLSIREHLRRLG